MKTTCPECLEQFDISSEMTGKKAKCGECSHVFVVPDSIEKKSKKKSREEDCNDVQQTAWLSLYLDGLALLMLLYTGHQGGMIASLLFALAIESAALYLVWRAHLLVWPLRVESEAAIVKIAVLVNIMLLGLFGLSILLSLYALIAGSGAGGAGGLGGLNDIMKSLQDVNKLMPK